MISLVRVINGPVAKAGSIFIRFNKSGKAVPKIDAKRITTKSDSVTVMGMARVCIPKHKVSKNMIEEQIVALIRAPPISFTSQAFYDDGRRLYTDIPSHGSDDRNKHRCNRK